MGIEISHAHRCSLKRLPMADEVYELREPLDHIPGDVSHTKAMQFGQQMKQKGFVGQWVGNHNGYAVVRFFKP